MDVITRREIARFVENQVQNIDLSNRRLTKFPMQILDIDGLTHLKLSNNQITEIPESINYLGCLQFLDLSNNQITSLPDTSFSKLHALRVLNLSNNRLLFFPKSILKLKRLEHLYLKNNQIVNIPREVSQLKSMKVLFIGDNNISNLPLEIVETQSYKSSFTAIVNYFEALEKGEDELFEAKLLLVGRGKVGKTSIANKIKDINYKLQGEDTTRGIDILDWSFINPDNNDIKVNIWDFGGQPIYYKTHQFFLTKRSFYILVWDARTEEDYKSFNYWLNVIKLLSDNSPVAIVQNKIDERVDEIEQKLLKEKFPNITDFFKISCGSNKGIEALKEHLKEQITNLPHIGDLLPSVWIEIRKSLFKINENYITYERYLAICKSFTLNETRADLLSDYLHDLGSILHFSSDPLLKQMVILKPEWATQAVYLLVDNSDAKKSHGRLTYSKIEKIWKENGYIYKHAELIKLMQKFEMCFLIEGQYEDQYIIPQLLRPDKPDNFLWNEDSNMFIEYKYVFMPVGIFTRLMVKLNSSINDRSKIWRNGVVFSHDSGQTKAFVENRPFEDKIVMKIKGADKPGLLSLIRMTINEIHLSLNKPVYNEKCGCICSACKEKDRNLYDLSKLSEAIKRGIEHITCDNSWEEVKIKELLFGINKLDELMISSFTNESITKNEEDDIDKHYARIGKILHSFITENAKTKDEISFLTAQLDIVTETLADKEDRQNALNIINSFCSKQLNGISNSIAGAAIIELGKLIVTII